MPKILTMLLMLGILTSPFYLLPSGSIQVYHAIFALISLLVLFQTGGLKTKPIIISAIAFWAYVVTRQSLFIMANAEASLATLLYPTLNMAVFLGVYMVLTDVLSPRGIESLLRAIVAVLVFEVGYIFVENGSVTFFMHSDVRSLGTFNNPNQLGYFAVLMGCAFVSMSTVMQSSKWLTVLAVSLAYLLAIISLSKAAMLAIAPLFLLVIANWSGQMRSKLLRASIFAAGLALLLLVAVVVLGQIEGLASMDNEVVRRLALIGRDSDDMFVARGYALILNPDERIIFGYGEGYYDMLFGNEVHSTLANVLTSFGIIGFALFSIMILNIVRFRIISLQFSLVILVFAYGLTHNGLRNTLFWIFLAVIAWSAKQVLLTKNQNKVSARA